MIAYFAIYDGFPVSKGHTLIIPKRHVADYFDLTEDEVMAMQALMRDIKAKIDAEVLKRCLFEITSKK